MTTATPCAIGSRLEPFIDHYLIDKLVNSRLQMHRPQFADVALRFNQPWEGFFTGCFTIIKDGSRYRMYYRGMPEHKYDGSDVECTCCAESDDGIHWRRLAIDRFEYRGHTKNNIVIYNQLPASHNFCPFIDTRPGVPANERYKAIGGVHKSGIMVYTSADGLSWRKIREQPILTSPRQFAFDSQNVAFWSEHENCYVCYFRTWHSYKNCNTLEEMGNRWISRATSPDFLNWSSFVEMQDDAGSTEHLYTQQTHPYYRAPHIYLSLAMRFNPNKRGVSSERAKELNIDPTQRADCSDTVLLTSRGGNRYDRTFMESFVRPGRGDCNWNSRSNACGLNIVPTGPGEMSLYVHREYAQPTAHLARHTLRVDGLASVNAPHAGGEMTTKPLTFTGSQLLLNYATSAAGAIRVEIQDANGQPIPGYTLADSAMIFGDEIEAPARWTAGPDVATLAGKPIRLRFVMNDADVYSLRFR